MIHPLIFDVKDTAEDFSANFLNLAKNFPRSSNEYGVLSVAQYYSHFGLTKNLIYYLQRKVTN